MESVNKYPRQRAAGREHIPLYPKGFIAIRVVQLILALVVTALCAFGIYLLPFSGNCLMIFVVSGICACTANLPFSFTDVPPSLQSISTMIVTTWLIVAEFGIPKVYNYWAVLALDIFLVVFWLSSFGLLASQAAYLLDSSAVCDYYGYCYSSAPTGVYLIFTACMAAAAGIGGLEL